MSDIIDINIGISTENIEITVTPNLTTVNVNTVANVSTVTSVNGQIGDVVLNIPSNTSDLTNDGADGVNPFITALDIPTFASADKMITTGRNATGATLYKGTVVYISGSTGNRPNFVKAQANSEGSSAGTFGIVLSDIPNNTDGNAVIIGSIDNLDTRSNATNPFTADTLVDGDTIYLSPTTAGYITRVKPSAPNHLVYIGKVVRTSPTNGTIVYRIQNGYELEELHNVSAITPNDNEILGYDTSTTLWKPKTALNIIGDDYIKNNPSSSQNASIFISGNIEGGIGSFNGYAVYANRFIRTDGLSSQFLKADGSIDSSSYYLASNPSNYISTISGINAGGELSGTYANPSVLNSAVVGKVLTGVNITGGTILATDSLLTAFGKLQNQINGVLGGAIYQSVWNASTNSPALTSSVGTKGYYYIVSVDGSTNLNGITDWKIGDWAIYNGTTWNKVDNSDSVSSVNGFTGAVSLTTANISEVTNLYYTDARARAAISLTTTGNSGVSTYLSGVLNIPNYTLSGLGGQAALSGTGFVKSTAGVISYDTNIYLTSAAPVSGSANYIQNQNASVQSANMWINNGYFSGNVSVGTNNPTYKLHVIAPFGGVTPAAYIEEGEFNQTTLRVKNTNAFAISNLIEAANSSANVFTLSPLGAGVFANSVTATAYITVGGTSTQYVMGDGSLSSGGSGGTGTTNLSYASSPTNGIVVSDTGTDATIPLADGTNAGLLKPSDFTQLSNLTTNLSNKQTITSNYNFNDTTKVLSLLDTNTSIAIKGVASDPATPASGNLLIYAKSIGGKTGIKTKDEYGVDMTLQNSFWDNNITKWALTTATAGVWEGTAGAGAGTYTTVLPTVTSLYTSIKRGVYSNVVTTLNQVLGQRNTEAMFFRGSVANQGGFFFYARFGFDTWTNGSRFFGGLHSGTTVISADPSALNNTIGFCIDVADLGVISFLTRGTVATKASTGFTAVTGKGYDIYMFAAPNSSQVSWKIEDINAGTESSGIATLTLPTNTTMLTAGVLASNAALVPVNSVQLGINKIYLETDY